MSDRSEVQQEMKDLQGAISNYKPGSTFRFEREKPQNPPDYLRIGLFGPPGVGKSSLVNSLNFATMEAGKEMFRWQSIAPEGYSDAPSKTVERTPYFVAENIAIIDNRGMKQLGGRFMVELGNQIAGVYGDGKKVEWDVGFIRSVTAGLERAHFASKECQIHCTVLVIKAVNLSIRATDLTELFAQIKKMTGQPPIVVITHRRQPGVVESVISEFRDGLQREGFDYVFDVENYTRNNHNYSAEKHLDLLRVLRQCTMVGDRVMKQMDTAKDGSSCVIL